MASSRCLEPTNDLGGAHNGGAHIHDHGEYEALFRTDNPAVIFALPLYAIGAAVMGMTVWHTILAVGQALGFH
jgi:hypothetical protein